MSNDEYITSLFSYCEPHNSTIKSKKVTFVIKDIGSSNGNEGNMKGRKVSLEIVSRTDIKRRNEKDTYYMNLENFKKLLENIQGSSSAYNSQEIEKILQDVQKISEQKITNDCAYPPNNLADEVKKLKISVNNSRNYSREMHMDIVQIYSPENAQAFAEQRCREGILQENSRPSSAESNIQEGNWSPEEEEKNTFSSKNNKLPPLKVEDFSIVKIYIYKSVRMSLSDYIDKNAISFSLKRPRLDIDLSQEVDNFLPTELPEIDLCSIIVTSKLKIKYKGGSTRDSENSESIHLDRIKVGAFIDGLLLKGIIKKIYAENAFQIENLKKFEDEVKGLSWRA